SGKRLLDGTAAVGLDFDLGARAGRYAGADRVEDGLRILGARIVGGEHDAVGETGRHLAHLGALRVIAVAAGAEHDVHTPGRERTHGLEQALERVGRVRVVDIDRERLPALDRLEPAGHADHRGEARRTFLGAHAEHAGDGPGAERVLDV